MKVRDVMTAQVVTVGPEEPVSTAARLLKRHNVGALPVCDSAGRLRGILTDRDIVTRCMAEDGDAARLTVGEVMSRGIETVGPEELVDKAAACMCQAQIRRVPVVEDGRVIGMLALGDMARQNGYEMEAAAALAEISSNVHRR